MGSFIYLFGFPISYSELTVAYIYGEDQKEVGREKIAGRSCGRYCGVCVSGVCVTLPPNRNRNQKGYMLRMNKKQE